MGIEQRDKRIGGVHYRVTMLPAKVGRAMLVRLIRMAGPGVGSFVGGVGRAADSTVDSAIAVGVSEALHDVTSRLREDELAAIMDELARYTTVVVSVELEPNLLDIFDDHFAGRYDQMLAWSRFALEVNFQSFFAGASGSAPLARFWKILQTLQALQSPQPSTGTSTASPPVAATPTA